MIFLPQTQQNKLSNLERVPLAFLYLSFLNLKFMSIEDIGIYINCFLEF